MAALIKKEKEPITSLIAKVRALHREHGVSTVIVVGGLGDWLEVATDVITMDSYVPKNITTEAKAVVAQYPTILPEESSYGTLPHRRVGLNLASIRSPFAPRKDFITLRPQAKEAVSDPALAEPGIELRGVSQLVEVGQTQWIATLLGMIGERAPSKL
jgi:hypothetical protein